MTRFQVSGQNYLAIYLILHAWVKRLHIWESFWNEQLTLQSIAHTSRETAMFGLLPTPTRGVQNSKKFDSVLALWFFPLYILSGVTKKNFSLLTCLEQPPQTYFKIQRIFQKIQRKKYIFTIFIFSAFKPVSRMIWGVWLHSRGPDASFDTHIDLFVNNKCGIKPASKVAFMAFLT